MSATLVIHRYMFTVDEAIRALLADQAGDCAGWSMRIESGTVLIDVVEPGAVVAPPPAPARPQEETPAEPERPKGGPLAKRCSTLCRERGFWTFLGVQSQEEATADIHRRCDVESRALLDHNPAAATIWRDIEGKYQLWLNGHDIEL